MTLQYDTGQVFHPTESFRYYDMRGRLMFTTSWPLPAAPPYAEAETLAREKFYSQVRSAQTTLQGLTALGELAETLHMIRNPAKALHDGLFAYLKALRKGRNKAGKTTRKRNAFVANTWLEYSFGWAPLFNDVRDAAHALVNSKNRHDRSHLVVSGYGETKSDEVKQSHTTSNGPLRISWVDHLLTSTSVRYKGAIVNRRQTTYENELENWGFAPSNFLPTIWELIPYSFLVDYFTNVGKVIDSFALRDISLGWGVRTQRVSAISRALEPVNTSTHGGASLGSSASFDPGEYEDEISKFDRTVVTSVPIPNLRFRIPGLSLQWINMAALGRTHAKMIPF